MGTNPRFASTSYMHVSAVELHIGPLLFKYHQEGYALCRTSQQECAERCASFLASVATVAWFLEPSVLTLATVTLKTCPEHILLMQFYRSRSRLAVLCIMVK